MVTVLVYVGMTQLPHGGQVPGRVVVDVVGQQSVAQGTSTMVWNAMAGQAMGVDRGGHAKHGTVMTEVRIFTASEILQALRGFVGAGKRQRTSKCRGGRVAARAFDGASPMNGIDKGCEARCRNGWCGAGHGDKCISRVGDMRRRSDADQIVSK